MNPHPRMMVRMLVWVISFTPSLAVPSICRAGCGDYVVIGEGTSTLRGSPSSSGPRLPADPSRPCSGMGCSRHIPASSAPSAPITVNLDLEVWLGLAVLQPFRCPGAGAFEFQSMRISPFDFGLGIYHPPRHSA